MYNAELSANLKSNGNEDIFPIKKRNNIQFTEISSIFSLQQFF